VIINNRNLIPTIPEAEMPINKVAADSVSDEGLLLIDCVFCVSSPSGRKANKLPQASFIRALIPLVRTVLS
jgi:hypothetical protein